MRLISLGLILSGLLCGCAKQTAQLDNLSSLQNIPLQNNRNNNSSDNHLKLQAIEEIAISTGAQAALAMHSQKINSMLSKYANYLDEIFPFQKIILPNNVLPPILSSANANINMDLQQESIRIASKSYVILRPAKFVTTAPNWRNYLIMSFLKPSLPNKSMLPKNIQEKIVWAKGVAKGWNYGIQQANNIFKNNLRKLQQEFTGMLLYKHLLAYNMVTAPMVAKSNLGITQDNNELRINDQVYRIVNQSKLQSDYSKWQPIIQK